jgi:SAM-dependent MidA family methyltransferase
MSVPAELPELTDEESAHVARVQERLAAVIEAAGGWIGFERYMQVALYEPGLGYYSAGARKFGAAGDFVTAPEVAPVFSRCLALQCAEVLAATGTEAVLLEIGAGSGAMAADLLAELERCGALPREYWILDVSADLRERQHATVSARLPHLLDRVRWLDKLPEVFDGVLVANEVLDAMPVARFTIREGQVVELGVGLHAGELHEVGRAAPEPLQYAVRRIESALDRALPEGYASEINLGLAPWLAAVAERLRHGVMLFVDYGLPRPAFYSDERSQGTLLCHFRHRFHDRPLERPGLQDITAWVDFTAVAESALDAGLEVAGYTTQAHFLIGCDIAGFVADVSGLDLVERLALSRQAMVLTLPGEMGERFKVIALARGYDAPLRGFAVRDLRHTL